MRSAPVGRGAGPRAGPAPRPATPCCRLGSVSARPRPAGAAPLVLPLRPAAPGSRGRPRRARTDRMACDRLGARGGSRGASPDPGAAAAGERTLRSTRSLRLPSSAGRLGRLQRAARRARTARRAGGARTLPLGTPGRRVGDREEALPKLRAKLRRLSSDLRFEDAARLRDRIRRWRRWRGARAAAAAAGARASASSPAGGGGRRGVLRRQGAGRLQPAVHGPDGPRVGGGPGGGSARGADARARGSRRAAAVAAFLRRPGPELEVVALPRLESMNELRERALGARLAEARRRRRGRVPVELRRGPAVKIVDGVRTETVPSRTGRRGSTGCSRPRGRCTCTRPDGDVHARRTKRGRWLVSRGRPSRHGTAAAEPRPGEAAPAARRSSAVRRDAELAGKRRQVQHYVELLRSLPVWGRERVASSTPGAARRTSASRWSRYGREARRRRSTSSGSTSTRPSSRRCAGSPSELGYDEARFEATRSRPTPRRAGRRARVSARVRHGDRRGDRRRRSARAEAIVVAPCCHHELAAQIAARPPDALLRHGLLLGRQADLVTDALRAAALESSATASR